MTTTTYDTSTDTAEKVLAKWHDITWRNEIATSMLCSHANRDRYGNSTSPTRAITLP